MKKTTDNEDTKDDLFNTDPMLGMNVNEKDYSKKNARIVNSSGTYAEIPEQIIPVKEIDISKPNSDENIFDDDVNDSKTDEELPPKPPSWTQQGKKDDMKYNNKHNKSSEDYINPQFKEQDKKSQKKGAESFAEMIIGVYSVLCNALANYATLDEADLKKIAKEEGVPIDYLYSNLELEDGETITIKQYLDDYNKDVTRAFTVDNEFRDKVFDDLVSICMSKGWGLTPEQSIMYNAFGHLLKAGIKVFMGRKQISMMIKSIGQMIKDNNIQQQSVNHTQQQSNIPTVTNDADETVIDEAPPIPKQTLSNKAVSIEDMEFHNSDNVKSLDTDTSPKKGNKKEIKKEIELPQYNEPEEQEFDSQTVKE